MFNLEHFYRIDRVISNTKRIADALGVDWERDTRSVLVDDSVCINSTICGKFDVWEDDVEVSLSNVSVDLAVVIAGLVRNAS